MKEVGLAKRLLESKGYEVGKRVNESKSSQSIGDLMNMVRYMLQKAYYPENSHWAICVAYNDGEKIVIPTTGVVFVAESYEDYRSKIKSLIKRGRESDYEFYTVYGKDVDTENIPWKDEE